MLGVGLMIRQWLRRWCIARQKKAIKRLLLSPAFSKLSPGLVEFLVYGNNIAYLDEGEAA